MKAFMAQKLDKSSHPFYVGHGSAGPMLRALALIFNDWIAKHFQESIENIQR
jgi:hypothetical protein